MLCESRVRDGKTRLTKLAAAAAVCESMLLAFPIPRGVLATLGSALPCIATPFNVLLTPTPLPFVCGPVIVECLFGAAGVIADLMGDWLWLPLVLVMSRVRIAVPFLKLVVGGSGSGRVLTDV